MVKRSKRVQSRIEPLGDKIVVKPTEAESTTSGGVVLPETALERPQQGRVLSVGCGRLLANGQRAAPQVVEGDRIVFGSYAGTEIELNGSSLLIMSESEILAILD